MTLGKACWMKFKFRYVDDYFPIERNKNLTLGRVVHEAFELHYRGADKDSIISHISRRYKEEMAKCEMTDQEALIIDRATALGMWMNNPFIRERYDSVEVEEEKDIPFIGRTRLIYKMDAKVKLNNHCWLIERKVTSQDKRKFDNFCRTSSQVTNYIFAERLTGQSVDGVIFECIRRPLLRKGVTETADEFARRITRDYNVRPDFYYDRKIAYRSQDELDLFAEDTKKLISEMRRRIRKNEFYRNTDHCWAFNSECPYMKICFSKIPDPLLLELYYVKGGGHNDNRIEERQSGQS